MIHDIDYLAVDQKTADVNFITNLQSQGVLYTPLSVASYLAFKAKDFYGYDVQKDLDSARLLKRLVIAKKLNRTTMKFAF